MSRILRCVVGCVVLCAASLVWAQDPPVAETHGEQLGGALHQSDGQTLAVYAARSIPAADLANLVQDLIGNEGNLRIEAERQHNSLVLHGPSDAVAVVLKLLQTLDRPAVKVHVRLWAIGIPCEKLEDVTQMLSTDLSADDVGARLQQAQTDGQLKILDHVALATLTGQSASVQVGQNLPLATAEQQTQRGTVRSFTMHAYGLMAKLTPVVTGDEVTVELMYEKSEPQRVPNASGDESEFVPEGTITRQSSSKTVLRSGTATLLSGGPLPGVEGCAQWRLILAVQTDSP